MRIVFGHSSVLNPRVNTFFFTQNVQSQIKKNKMSFAHCQILHPNSQNFFQNEKWWIFLFYYGWFYSKIESRWKNKIIFFTFCLRKIESSVYCQHDVHQGLSKKIKCFQDIFAPVRFLNYRYKNILVNFQKNESTH